MKLHHIIAAILLTGIALAELPLAAQSQEDHIVVRRRYTIQEEEPKKPDPEYRTTGPYLRISTGIPMVASLALDYYITPWFMAGGGIGVSGCGHYHYSSRYRSFRDRMGLCVPVFAEAELRTPRHKWSFFANLKVGWNMLKPSFYFDSYNWVDEYVYYSDEYDSFQAVGTAGFGYKNLNVGLGYSADGFGVVTLSYQFPVSGVFF